MNGLDTDWSHLVDGGTFAHGKLHASKLHANLGGKITFGCMRDCMLTCAWVVLYSVELKKTGYLDGRANILQECLRWIINKRNGIETPTQTHAYSHRHTHKDTQECVCAEGFPYQKGQRKMEIIRECKLYPLILSQRNSSSARRRKWG